MTINSNLFALIASAAVGVGAMYLFNKGWRRNDMKAKLDKLVMLSEEVSSSKDIARTTMRLQALNAQIQHALFEEVRRTHERKERDRIRDESAQLAAAKNNATAEADRMALIERVGGEHSKLQQDILATLKQLVVNTSGAYPAKSHRKPASRRAAKSRRR